MNAEIITSGTELLLGDIVDTNSTYIARALRDIGVNVFFKVSVGDNVERMAQVLRQAMERSDLIITTGGLGPTVDDVTREAVALATDRQLVLFPESLAQIEAIFARWGRQMGENNKRQAYLPAGAIAVANPVGTAPAFIVETGRCAIFSLPGVPREMEHLMQIAVLPYLRQSLGEERTIIKTRTLRTVALGESWIDERLDPLMRMANPTVGLAAHHGAVDIRIGARADTEPAADQMIAEAEKQIRDRIGNDAVFGVNDDTLEEATGQLLEKAGAGLVMIESNTAGDVAAFLKQSAGGKAAVQADSLVDSQQALERFLPFDQKAEWPDEWVSEPMAVLVATELHRLHAPAWGLAVLGDMAVESDVYGGNSGHTYAALVTPWGVMVRSYPYGGTGALARRWVTVRVVDMVRRQALAALATAVA